MTEHNITFATKFTQKSLEYYIKQFWNNSFEADSVTFDLSVTEWVSSEEVAFLFSWVVKLRASNKKVKVILPYSYDISNDSKDSKDRRKFLKYYLLKVWGMLSNVELTDLNFENLEGYMASLKENAKFNYGKRIIPFQRIPVSFTDYASEKVDEKYNSIKSSESGVFFLESEIINFLNQNDCYSPFENKVISDIITKELVINSMEHTNEDESFFTTALSDKWQKSDNSYFIDHYKKEREECTLDFFKNKEVIQKNLEVELSKLNSKQKEKLKDLYYPSLEKYDNFKNQSFLEFTYIDYGEGIHSTLNEQFDNFKTIGSFDNVSNNFNKKNRHTQILEYAFLLESSKEPFDDDETRYNELIPRGLYFIVDMVRRYKGLLVARSGSGKVIYDFSNRLKIKKTDNNSHKTFLERIYVAKDAIIDIPEGDSFFPGTMISIVLPQRKSIDFKKSGVRIDSEELNKIIFNRDNSEYYPAEIYEPESYEFLNLAFEYQKGEEEATVEVFNSKTGIIKTIFRSISNKLNMLSGKNCVLFIDFEYIPIKDNNSILKILLYLSNNPMVNERTKVIVLNIDKEDIHKLKEYEVENFGEFEPNSSNFLFKPIPCLRIDKNKEQQAIITDIQWIGVHNPEDLQILTNLFFGKIESNVGIDIDLIDNNWLYEGNVITKHNERAYSIFTDFQELLNKAKETKTRQLEEWLISKVIDGKNPKKEDEFYFLTSRGSYQRKYLSLYESLNYKYTTRYFAQYLLDKYLDSYIKSTPEEYKELTKFDKIIVVTVSSQLLGVEIRNLIKENDSYAFLRTIEYLKNEKGNKAKIIDCPKLIKLASYFSFDSEKPFKEIDKEDKVLIVNDVISTGSLLKRIIEGVENKGAIVSGVVAVADSRKKNVDETKEYESDFFKDLESKIVSILSYENNNDFNLVKLRHKPLDVKKVKRINPILNAVISLKSEHTEIIKLLYEDPEELITKEPFQNDIFRIGHFKQNITHNSYFTNMHNLFFDENGKKLLSEIKNRIDQRYPKIDINNNDFILSYLNGLKQKAISKDSKEFTKAINLIIDNTKNDNQNSEYKPKFIFHPVYSGIEEVSEDILHKVFGTDKANIISLQRYETKNGWRFPFPAKRFNTPTKGAHILILDSGALSGHSLVQLIDSISFLDVGKIDFLSIVGRIDDFQREFYSRLRSIRVKHFTENETERLNPIINLNIIFGINLHIPPTISAESCPYCTEIKKLERYLNDNEESKKLPTQTINYIKARIEEEIPLIEDSSKFEYPNYLPTLKDDEKPDFVQIFNMRDRLGKVDSYRFYVEYFKYFDDIGNQIKTDNISELFDSQNEETLKKIELILTCLIHEPHLVNVLKDLLASIFEISIVLIDEIISQPKLLKSLSYSWNKYAIVKLSYSLKSQNKLTLNDFYHYQYFSQVFDFASGCQKSLNFLSYLLSGSFYGLNGDEFSNRYTIKKVMIHIKAKYAKNTKGGRVLNNLLEKIKRHEVNSIKEAIDNLNTFFLKEEAKEGHTEIELAFNDITTVLVNIDNHENSNENISILFNNIKYIVDALETSVYKNLKYLKNKGSIDKWLGKYYELIFGNDNIFFTLENLLDQFKKLNSKNLEQDNLITIAREFDALNTEYFYRDVNTNSFYQFCSDSTCELNATIVNIVSRQNTQGISIKYELTEKDEIVQIHKVFLERTIKEILRNAEKKAKRDEVKTTLKIITTTINKNEIELRIEQDSNFDNTGIEGGFYNLVKPILREFGQSDSFQIVEESPHFIFKVNFKV